MTTDRRDCLKLLSTAAASTAFPASIARALAIPANNRTGTIHDVEHIVFMMQENRSFDHYFGTLRGARFRRPPNGQAALREERVASARTNPDGYVLPLHSGCQQFVSSVFGGHATRCIPVLKHAREASQVFSCLPPFYPVRGLRLTQEPGPISYRGESMQLVNFKDCLVLNRHDIILTIPSGPESG